MTADPDPPAPAPRPPSLDTLSGRVRAARAAVERLRHGPANCPPMASARHHLLVALEDYVTALETRRLPVPGALRRELQLHRNLFD